MLPNRLDLIECTSKVALFDTDATSSEITTKGEQTNEQRWESARWPPDKSSRGL